jgi:hypothetical protein
LPKDDNTVGLNHVPAFLEAIRPAHHEALQVGAPSKPEVNPNVAGAQVTRIGVHSSPERFFPVPENLHSSANAEPIGPDAYQSHLEPVLSGLGVVVKEANRPVVVRDEDVDGSVVVDVADRHATADVDAPKILSGTVAHVAEFLSLAFTMKEQVFLPVRVRTASQ